MKKAIMILAVFCSLAVTGSAQKFALIDMEYILKSIPAYEMANEQLKQVSTRWQREIETKAKEAETLFNNYKSEQVYLSKEQQQSLYDTMECEDCTPSLAQAIKMKEFSRDGKLTEEVILSIMQEEKPNQREQFKMPKERISKYFAPGTPAQKIEDTIIKALELYRRRERQRDMER